MARSEVPRKMVGESGSERGSSARHWIPREEDSGRRMCSFAGVAVVRLQMMRVPSAEPERRSEVAAVLTGSRHFTKSLWPATLMGGRVVDADEALTGHPHMCLSQHPAKTVGPAGVRAMHTQVKGASGPR